VGRPRTRSRQRSTHVTKRCDILRNKLLRDTKYKSTTLHTDGRSKYQLQLNSCHHIPHILKQTTGSANYGLTCGSNSQQGTVAIHNKIWVHDLFYSCLPKNFNIDFFILCNHATVCILCSECVNFRKVMSFRMTYSRSKHVALLDTNSVV
jgi:hypothetical protein